MAPVLSVESVSKKFRLQNEHSYNLKETLFGWVRGRRQPAQVHWALHDISFELEEGRALGIIGHNGAGKSTLLRLLCGLGRPTSGRIRRRGQVSGLLDLGGGLHPDMTGRENIMTGGLLSGLTRQQVHDLEEEIIDFAELEAFIDQPTRTYSNGMYLRLAFAAAMHFDPTVLIIDEVLAVGDTRFRQKCLDRLNTFRLAGKTLVLTSHVMSQIRSLCDEVLVIEDGKTVMQGEPEEAIRCHNDLMRERSERRAREVFGDSAIAPETTRGKRRGSQEASISTIAFYEGKGDQPIDSIESGQGLVVELSYTLQRQVEDMILMLGVFTGDNIKCYETQIPSMVAAFGSLKDHGKVRCRLDALPLLPGTYFVNVGLYPLDWSFTYDSHWQMHPLHVIDPLGDQSNVTGTLRVQVQWAIAGQGSGSEGAT
jgi:lipopolysaccharide transport system ATP-binding protein